MSHADSGLTASTTYRYRVRATDAAGLLSGYSNIASATTAAAPDTQAPTAPSGLTATAAGATQINLSWTASTDNVGVTGYRVERCQGAACVNFVQVATPTGVSHADSGLTANTTYRYRVRATDAAGLLSGYSNIASATTAAAPDTQAPTAPSGLTATAAGATQINLSWTASTDNVGVTGYRVERCQGASCVNFVQVATPTGVSHADSGLTANTTYRYRVRATDAAGLLSGYSNIASATTAAAPDTQAPTAPSGLTATAAGATQINLSWTASTDNVGVTGYRVERCQGASCVNFVQVATPTGVSHADSGLTASTTYRYRVRATDAAGLLSGYSNIASATTAAPTSAISVAPSVVVGGAPLTVTWSCAGECSPNDWLGIFQADEQLVWSNEVNLVGPTFTVAAPTTPGAYEFRYCLVNAGPPCPSVAAFTVTAIPGDTQPPTDPSGLTATAAGATQINLSWTASTGNVGLTGYQVERCQGAPCVNFVQIATPPGASHADSGLTASTTYRYRERATDAAGLLSGYSTVPSATTSAAPDTQAPTAPSGLAATAAGTATNSSLAAAYWIPAGTRNCASGGVPTPVARISSQKTKISFPAIEPTWYLVPAPGACDLLPSRPGPESTRRHSVD